MPDKLLLISIRPEYADKIFDGTKKVELRKVYPRQLEEKAWVLVYVSSPVKAVIGAFQVERVIEATTHCLWRTVREDAGITHLQFKSYYEGASVGYGIVLNKAMKFNRPVELSTLKELWDGFHPPQCFRYLSSSEAKQIEKLSQSAVLDKQKAAIV